MILSQDKCLKDIEHIFDLLIAKYPLNERCLLVLGASTSIILGKSIGQAGNIAVAKIIYKGLGQAIAKYKFQLAVQCCEHLNRALVVEDFLAQRNNLNVVSAIPTPGAGGSMASVAFSSFKSPVLVENIAADLGIDIGGTLIGMHLKPVAIPLHTKIKIGHSSVLLAYTRPKLIGGQRAVYTLKD